MDNKDTIVTVDNLKDYKRAINGLKVTCMLLVVTTLVLSYGICQVVTRLNVMTDATVRLSDSVESLYKERQILNKLEEEASWIYTEEDEK